jgi:hypothetical protein
MIPATIEVVRESGYTIETIQVELVPDENAGLVATSPLADRIYTDKDLPDGGFITIEAELPEPIGLRKVKMMRLPEVPTGGTIQIVWPLQLIYFE